MAKTGASGTWQNILELGDIGRSLTFWVPVFYWIKGPSSHLLFHSDRKIDLSEIIDLKYSAWCLTHFKHLINISHNH